MTDPKSLIAVGDGLLIITTAIICRISAHPKINGEIKLTVVIIWALLILFVMYKQFVSVSPFIMAI